MVLSCKQLQKAFGIDEILTDVTFILEEKEKAAVVGINGAGKTTLFRLITGEYSIDDGELIINAPAGIGYLPQTAEFDSQNTLYGELETVFSEVRAMEAEMRSLEKEMAVLTDEALKSAMNRYAWLTQTFEERKGYEYKSRLRGVIKGLGFSQDEWEQPVRQFSGGQKTRLALGKLLLSEPDLLLMDEPTNHLDIESIQWLEEFLKSYNGSILIISHDRYFMDKTVTKVIEIDNKKSVVYNGNYTYYAKKKSADREILLKHYLEQQKEIKRQENIIKTLRSFNREKSIRKAESREKMLDRMERVEKPASIPEKMRLFLTPKLESGNDVLFVEDVSKSFDAKPLFAHMSFAVKKGDKVAMIGPNGIGKTTLFRIIMEELAATAGKIKRGVNVRIGYYDQEHQQLDENKTIIQEISDTYPRLLTGQIRNVLAAFVFTGDDVFKPISALSGGEKGRVSLAKIMLNGANFLILDEPTNHLDMYSKEVLEEALRDFPGTVLYISHDRYFINNTADKIVEMNKDGCRIFLGNYDFYMEKKAEDQKNTDTTSDFFVNMQKSGINDPERLRNKEQAGDKQNEPLEISTSKAGFRETKLQKAEERKRKALLAQTERRISELEAEMNELELLLSKEEIYSDHVAITEACEKRMKLESELSEMYALWETYAE